jgi:hypothetical protein
VKIIIQFEDKKAVILIVILTILGWFFSYSIIYTSYYLSTGQDPLAWMEQHTFIPKEVIDVLRFIGINAGYISILAGMVLFTIIAIIIWRSKK